MMFYVFVMEIIFSDKLIISGISKCFVIFFFVFCVFCEFDFMKI